MRWRSSQPSAHRQRGVAAIEFALVLPILVVLFFGMINISQYISMTKRVNTTAELVADLVTRHSDTVPSTIIDDYFIAAELAMRPVPMTNVRVDLYGFYRDTPTGSPATSSSIKTRWKKSTSTGQGCTVPAPVYSNTSDPIASLMQSGDDVVVAVVCMPFTPLGDYGGVVSFLNGRIIEKQVVLKPRQSQTLTCTPDMPINCP